LHNHSVSRLSHAGQLRLGKAFHFNNTKAAGPVGFQLSQRLQVRVMTKGWNVDTCIQRCI
jgi:hypothetical protein